MIDFKKKIKQGSIEKKINQMAIGYTIRYKSALILDIQAIDDSSIMITLVVILSSTSSGFSLYLPYPKNL